MKRALQLVLASAAFAAFGALAQTYSGVGTVTRLDPGDGKVTLSHEAIKSLGWPAMTMSFDVKDRKLLGRMKTGQRVSFEFVEDKSRYVITAVR